MSIAKDNFWYCSAQALVWSVVQCQKHRDPAASTYCTYQCLEVHRESNEGGRVLGPEFANWIKRRAGQWLPRRGALAPKQPHAPTSESAEVKTVLDLESRAPTCSGS